MSKLSVITFFLLSGSLYSLIYCLTWVVKVSIKTSIYIGACINVCQLPYLEQKKKLRESIMKWMRESMTLFEHLMEINVIITKHVYVYLCILTIFADS